MCVCVCVCVCVCECVCECVSVRASYGSPLISHDNTHLTVSCSEVSAALQCLCDKCYPAG